jgi:PAS domain S-box-containing protein
MEPAQWLDFPQNRTEVILLALAIISLGIVFCLLLMGYSPIVAYLLYVPVMMVSNRYHGKGIYFAAILGIVYFLGEIAIIGPDIPGTVFSAGQSAMLVLIAWVISTLSILAETEHIRYRGIFDNTLTGIILLKNPDFTVVEANEVFGLMVGRNARELVGTPVRQFWQNESEYEAFRSTIDNYGRISEFEVQFVKPDNVPIWALLSATKLEDKTIICTATDISRRIRAEMLISVANAINQHIVHEMETMDLISKACREFGRLDPYFVVSLALHEHGSLVPVAITHQKYASVNTDLLHSSWVRDAVQEKRITRAEDIKHTGDVHFTGAYAFPMRVVLEVKGILMVYLISAGFLEDQEIETFQTLANDLAYAIKSMEIERQKMIALEQIEKNLEQLATLNDEIRNPLQAIIAFAELEREDFAKKIYQEVGKIDSLVNLLDIGWVESEKIREYLHKHHGLNKE